MLTEGERPVEIVGAVVRDPLPIELRAEFQVMLAGDNRQRVGQLQALLVVRQRAVACAPGGEGAEHRDGRRGRSRALLDALTRQADPRLVHHRSADDARGGDVQAVFRLLQADGAVRQVEAADPLVLHRVAVSFIAHPQAGRAIDLEVGAGRADPQALGRRHVGSEGRRMQTRIQRQGINGRELADVARLDIQRVPRAAADQWAGDLQAVAPR